MKDLKIISANRDYLEFEERVKFEYKGKTYEKVLYSSMNRDGMNALYIEDENGNDIDLIDDYNVNDIDDLISNNVKEDDIEVSGVFNYKN
tara:strand:- start:286 stop:555 length:270 start_codon:yes stop_codon:yes gene_type:complete